KHIAKSKKKGSFRVKNKKNEQVFWQIGGSDLSLRRCKGQLTKKRPFNRSFFGFIRNQSAALCG
ncbi:MAG: hypothetical protein IJ621_06995, partial [Paludibacteraceae bacterium]|nr:hypothetical protein [Paludibacteraceae bacterium]